MGREGEESPVSTVKCCLNRKGKEGSTQSPLGSLWALWSGECRKLHNKSLEQDLFANKSHCSDRLKETGKGGRWHM